MIWKPMKPPAGVLEDSDLHLVRFPVLGSVKLDGLRHVVQESRSLSSTLKEFPCSHLRGIFSNSQFEGLDGEFTVGSLTDGKCFSRSTSYFMADDPDPALDVWWNVFDKYVPNLDTVRRQQLAEAQVNAAKIRAVAGNYAEFLPGIRWVKQVFIHSLTEFLDFEKRCVDEGYEGAMYRSPFSFYKQGRSTLSKQELMRRKPFHDAEAVILAVFEEQENTNTAYTNEMGRTKRSSAKAGKVGKGTLGGFLVKGISAFPDVEFNIGAFGTDEECQELWDKRDWLVGKVIKYKYQKYGSKDKPRLPIALAFRDERDM